MSPSNTTRPRNPATAGFRVGILTLDTAHQLEVGNVQHAETFPFPVTYAVVRGVSFEALMAGDPSALPAILSGIADLEQRGVAAIVGACGSFAHFQRAAAATSQIPVFLSILLEVPLLLRALPPHLKLGVIFARISSFTELARSECGIEDVSRIVAIGADSVDAFSSVLQQRSSLDADALRSGLTELAIKTLEKHPGIAAWLLQCSDLPPYAAAIQQATCRPVFDMTLLIDHVYRATRRERYGNGC